MTFDLVSLLLGEDSPLSLLPGYKLHASVGSSSIQAMRDDTT